MRGVLAIAGWLLVCVWPLSAAEPPSAHRAPGPAAAAQPPTVHEAKPQIYYLPDKQGNLVAVPGMTWEDFERARQILMELASGQREPAYSIQRMAIRGTARNDHAELTVHLKIRAEQEGWVRIPLSFDGAALQEAKYQGPGEQFVSFEGPQAGYVCWVRGKAPAQPEPQHDLTLEMLVPLTRIGERRRMRLRAPRATVSELRLTVPVPNAQASVSPGALLRSVVSTPQGSEVTINEVAGDFELTWGQPPRGSQEMPPALEVDAVVLTRIGAQTIDSQATLTLSSQPAAFDHFLVRLPPGATASGRGTGYELVPVEGADGAGAEENLVEVRLEGKTRGPLEVQLSARLPYEPAAGNNRWIEVGGFEVIGAARQRGVVAVAAVSDWQVLWGPSRGVRQVDQLPAALQAEDVVAGFEYFVQPYSLKIRLVGRKTRVSIEPHYTLAVEADRLRLDATLTYTVRGPKLGAVEVEIPGWELSADQPPVGPDNLVAVDGVSLSSANRLTIPLSRPSGGRLEIQLHLQRALEAGADSFEVQLPQPEATWTAPAALTVHPAPNVELIPRSEAIQGLVRHAPPAATPGPAEQPEPLFYRAESLPAVFAAQTHLRRQELSVEVTSRLSIEGQVAEVEQTLDYTIAYEPADQLTLRVPQSVASSDFLEVLHEGEPAMVVPGPGGSAVSDPAQPVPVQVLLAKSCLGRCRLVVRYPLPPLEPLGAGETRWSMPLAMPAQGELLGNTLVIAAPPSVKVEPLGEGWQVLPAATFSGEEQTTRQWTSEQSRAEVLLRIASRPSTPAGHTVVQRAWVQTWLTHSMRQDRAAFRFTSTRPSLQLLLPAGAAREHVTISLDGQAVTPRQGESGSLEVLLPGGSSERAYVLELRYYFPQPRASRGRLDLELPRIDGGARLGRVYWQLVLPGNEHVIASPAGWIPESTWGWCGFFWGRYPVWEQEDLETWSGAAHRTPVPAGTNRYLYSNLGPVGPCRLRTAGRSWIVLVSSGAALVLGLVLLYVPAVRRPGLLLALAVGLVGAGAWSPATAVLVAQAAALGLVLTALAGLLQRVVVERRGRASPVGLGRETTATPWESADAPAPAPEQSSTQTGMAALPPSSGGTPE